MVEDGPERRECAVSKRSLRRKAIIAFCFGGAIAAVHSALVLHGQLPLWLALPAYPGFFAGMVMGYIQSHGNEPGADIVFCVANALFYAVASSAIMLFLGWPQPTETDRCDGCGYDLTKNVSGICPECGVVCAPLEQRDGSQFRRPSGAE